MTKTDDKYTKFAEVFMIENNVVETLKRVVNDGGYKDDFTTEGENMEFPFYSDDDEQRFLACLNEKYPQFKFEVVIHMIFHDIQVTDREAAATRERNLTNKTAMDAYNEAMDGSGVTSDIPLHSDMSERLTEKEYQKRVQGYTKLLELFEDD